MISKLFVIFEVQVVSLATNVGPTQNVRTKVIPQDGLRKMYTERIVLINNKPPNGRAVCLVIKVIKVCNS